jgi:single-strand DNA-binding protein
MLEGRLVFEQWTAQDGSTRSRHTLRVEEFKFLDTKNDSMGGGNYTAPQMQQPNTQMQQPQQQYSQPMQNNYNNQQSGGMHNSYEQNIPTIDIDNDEIPF